MFIYPVTKWYRIKERNYISKCEELHSSHASSFLNFLLIKSDKDYIRNACLFKIDCSRPIKQHILFSVDKELGKNSVLLIYHISMKIFRRGLIITCWRFLLKTSMVYSWVFWRYLSENLLWFSTVKPLKVLSRGLCYKIILRFNFETSITFSIEKLLVLENQVNVSRPNKEMFSQSWCYVVFCVRLKLPIAM